MAMALALALAMALAMAMAMAMALALAMAMAMAMALALAMAMALTMALALAKSMSPTEYRQSQTDYWAGIVADREIRLARFSTPDTLPYPVNTVIRSTNIILTLKRLKAQAEY